MLTDRAVVRISSRVLPGLRALAPTMPLLAWALLTAMVLVACGEPSRPTMNFYHAVHSGDLDQVKRHLYWGADANQAGPDGRYPLHVAVADGRMVIARTLLDHGARVNARNPLGQTPLYVALANGRVPAAELLMARGAADDPQQLLRLLVEDDHLDRDTLVFLVSRGVNLNLLGPDGLAPLHQSVLGGQRTTVKWLLQQGADVNLLSASGASALDLAMGPGTDANLIRILEQYGAGR